jgi:hypothetical protein
MSLADDLEKELAEIRGEPKPTANGQRPTVPRPVVSGDDAFAKARALRTADVCDKLGIEHDEKLARCPGCKEPGAAIALDRTQGLKCLHERCSGRGKNGYRTNVDLVMEVRGGTAVEACNWLAQQFGFEGFTARPEKKSTQPALDFEFVSTAEIFAPLPEPTYAVGGILRTGSLGLLGGYGGSSKTWLALQIAACVATGTPFLGRFDCEAGAVTILDWESGSFELRRRLQAIWKGSNLPAIDEGIDFVSMPDSYMGTEAFAKRVGALAAKRKLIVIDSLRAASPDAEENDSTIRRGLDQLRAIADKTGCSFLVLVHAKKTSGAPTRPDPREVLRGSSAIFDAADSILVVTVGQKDEPLRVEQVKARHGCPVDAFGVRIADRAGGVLLTSEELEEPEGKLTGSKRFEHVCKLVEKAVRAHPGSSQRFIRENLDESVHPTTVATALEQLAKLGRVANLGTKEKQEWRGTDG